MVSPTGPGTLKREVSFDTGVPVKDEESKSPVRKMSPKSTPG
jgi:hypothetical protein